ncbi:hypothetical protein BTR23_10690 [Alkalihalophilus pseudofirmus]|nr:hypothetical protein BTR23_10690 [Alkalihalophilus pseudofirmus]
MGVPNFQNYNTFAIHVLLSEQKEACWALSGKEKKRFSKVEWSLSNNNLPIMNVKRYNKSMQVIM